MNKEDKLILGTLAGVDLVLSPEHYEEYKGTLNKQLEEKDKEIERLNNIINELNEDIYHLLNVIGDNKDDIKVTSDEELAIFSCQNRLEELKENNNV